MYKCMSELEKYVHVMWAWTVCNTYSDILTMMMFSNSTWWCTLYDVVVLLCTLWYDDEHACFDVMTYFYALWCVLITYTLHFDDGGGHLMMMMIHTLWWCITYDDVQ